MRCKVWTHATACSRSTARIAPRTAAVSAAGSPPALITSIMP
jgi:hypothetical protein